MLDKPQLAHHCAQPAAVIRLTVPRTHIQTVMGPAMAELMATLASQGIAPAGPMFSRHFRIDPEVFDFAVGIPVAAPVTPSGRVQPGELPAATVLRSVYRGPYEGLGAAWETFCGLVAASGQQPAPGFWECYLSGPESSPDPATWATELNQPVAA